MAARHRAVAALAIALATAAAAEDIISGPATVVDGDGLTVGESEIRLFGIDAPEMREGAAGRASRSALEDLVAGGLVACSKVDTDRYKRVVAICTAGERDLGEAMLEQGQAVTYRRFLKDSPLERRYLDAEARARRAKLGVWAE